MPDPIPTTPVPAEPTPTPTPVAPSTPAEPPTPQQNRATIYRQYYDSQQAAEPGAAPPSEPSAQDGPSEPVAPSEPAPEPLSPTPAPADERFSQIEQTLSQVVDILAKLAPQPAPATPAPAQPVEGVWLNLLREGKISEAEAELAKALASRIVPQIKSESASEAVEMFRVEQELTSYVTDLRRKNPDLLPLEDMIASKAKIKLDAAQSAGKIRNADDYISTYKHAVEESAAEARKLIQTIRAAGKEEATIRSREVLSSSPVAPAAIDASRGVPTTPSPAKEDTAEDYITRRRQFAARTAGLAV